jgi:hypothetical protein
MRTRTRSLHCACSTVHSISEHALASVSWCRSAWAALHLLARPAPAGIATLAPAAAALVCLATLALLAALRSVPALAALANWAQPLGAAAARATLPLLAAQLAAAVWCRSAGSIKAHAADSTGITDAVSSPRWQSPSKWEASSPADAVRVASEPCWRIPDPWSGACTVQPSMTVDSRSLCASATSVGLPQRPTPAWLVPCDTDGPDGLVPMQPPWLSRASSAPQVC